MLTTSSGGSSPNSRYRLPHLPGETSGILIVDHGSRRDESNASLIEVVDLFRSLTGAPYVEGAHMELADPDIDAAFARLVSRGVTFVIVHPYFLAPGRHWREDIPRLTAAAAAKHPHVRFLVTPPLGVHADLIAVMVDRISQGCQQQRGIEGPELPRPNH